MSKLTLADAKKISAYSLSEMIARGGLHEIQKVYRNIDQWSSFWVNWLKSDSGPIHIQKTKILIDAGVSLSTNSLIEFREASDYENFLYACNKLGVAINDPIHWGGSSPVATPAIYWALTCKSKFESEAIAFFDTHGADWNVAIEPQGSRYREFILANELHVEGLKFFAEKLHHVHEVKSDDWALFFKNIKTQPNWNILIPALIGLKERGADFSGNKFFDTLIEDYAEKPQKFEANVMAILFALGSSASSDQLNQLHKEKSPDETKLKGAILSRSADLVAYLLRQGEDPLEKIDYDGVQMNHLEYAKQGASDEIQAVIATHIASTQARNALRDMGFHRAP